MQVNENDSTCNCVTNMWCGVIALCNNCHKLIENALVGNIHIVIIPITTNVLYSIT